MSGPTIGRALQERFETVRREEVDRLRRKLAGLSDEDRRSAEAIIGDIIGALARGPARVLAETQHTGHLQAVVRLFQLES